MARKTALEGHLSRMEEALHGARHSRHHRDCRCGLYRKHGSPYCTGDEYRWSVQIDDLIDTVRKSIRRRAARDETPPVTG